MTKLVLFDIDGTLIDSDGAGRHAMTAALTRVFGTPGPIETYSMAGKVDTEIVAELMSAAGLPNDMIESSIARYFAAYVEELEQRIGEHNVRALPGAVDLLQNLHNHRDVVIGVLTGNMMQGATIKLRSAGLAGYFDELGAFGDDAQTRRELPAIAVERARVALDRYYMGKNVVIVGDTPADIECGHSLGVRSIAVATGPHSCADLRQYEPDFCFPDLRDTKTITAAILSSVTPSNA